MPALIDTAHKATGRNVALVFRSEGFARHVHCHGLDGARVVDGDKTDMRFADPRGVISKENRANEFRYSNRQAKH